MITGERSHAAMLDAAHASLDWFINRHPELRILRTWLRARALHKCAAILAACFVAMIADRNRIDRHFRSIRAIAPFVKRPFPRRYASFLPLAPIPAARDRIKVSRSRGIKGKELN